MNEKPTRRITKQRKVILEELKKLTSHPTADEMYSLLRTIVPRISLGTVYRNLEILAEDGVIQKLEFAGQQKRFDGNAAEHYHARCRRCGRVDDLFMEQIAGVEDAARKSSDYLIMGHRLEFDGLCPACKKGRA